MCTIIVLKNTHPEFPVIVAANRDEFYSRPSRGPVVLNEEPRIVGGIDEEKGGTWMGVTQGGLFVGLTNQRSYAPRTRAPKSRGEVVFEALRCQSTERVRAYLGSLDATQFESFNLIYGDAAGLEVAYARRDQAGIEILAIEDGVSVLSNDRLDATNFPKLDRARQLVEPVVGQAWPELVVSLQAALADHELPGAANVEVPKDAPFGPGELRKLQALCVHTPHYGTRSSTVVALRPGGVAHYQYASAAPCSSQLVDATDFVSGP